jgi:hypothetical protein
MGLQMIVFYYLLFSLVVLYALWVFYIAVMNLKRVNDKKKFNTFGKILGYPVLFVGIALDIIANVFVMSVLFLELPKELLVTSRLKRHNRGTGWRKKIVAFLEPILDPFDPSGDHV